jgi:hypothetical protein
LRELLRYRHKLVGIRTSCKDQVHAVLAQCGLFVPMADLFGPPGTALLDQVHLPKPYAARVNSLRGVIDGVSGPQTAHPRLLWATRRRDPLPGQQSRGVSRPGHGRREIVAILPPTMARLGS